MRIAIHVRSGPAAGRRIVLRSGQIARFGRTDWADFSFPEDASMADVHFAISSANDTCVIEALAKENETLVNGQPIEKLRVHHGNIIQAGQSQFLLQIENDIAVEPTTEEAAPPPAPVEAKDDVVKLATYFGLSETATELAAESQDATAFGDDLMRASLIGDAVRWYAHYLPKPEAVGWGCLCIDQSMSESAMTPVQRSACIAARNWSSAPSEENRRAAERFIEETDGEGAGAALAAAAAWSGGSLAPDDCEVVPPDERLTGRCVTTALIIGSNSGSPPTDSAQRLLAYLKALPKQKSQV